MKLNLQQQVYMFTLSSCFLFVLLVISISWSTQIIDLAMKREKYASKVESHINILKQYIISENIYAGNHNVEYWLSLERKFYQLLKRAPSLTAQQKTIQLSIESQNENVLRLYRTISENKLQNAKDSIKNHLRIRLVAQLEAIRSDSIQLSSIAKTDIQNVIKHQAMFILLILSVAILMLIYGAIRLTKIFRVSLQEVKDAFEKNHSGSFQDIQLSNQTEEFSSIANAFNAMNQKLGTTMVSLESMKKIVDDRTHELELLTKTDPLTKAANRRALFERGEVEFSRVQRIKSQLAIILLDCDFFKNINDKYGHLVGDEILKNICKICSEEIRTVDFFARYGGEEFVILLPDCDLSGAVETAKRIQQSLAVNCLVFDEREICVTVSIGICETTTKHNNFGELIKDADTAMYKAKTNGRNKIEVLDNITRH